MYGSPGLAGLLGAGTGVSAGAGVGVGGRVPLPCRPRVWKVLLLLVGLLMMAQFSLNLLFYRNYDSLFYVNSTSPSTAETAVLAPLQNRLRWVSSRLSWMQPLPVTPPPHPASSSSQGNSSAQAHTNTTTTNTQAQNRTSVEGGAKLGPPSENSVKNESANQSDAKAKDSASKSDAKTKDDAKEKVNNNKKEGGKGKSNAKAKGRTLKPLHEVSTRGAVKNGDSGGGMSGDSGGGDTTTEKPICPPVPPKLVGRLKIERTAPSLEDQERLHTELEPGGHFRPSECRARHKVALIIPYRDRVTHLSVFLQHIHPMLQRQQVDYAIFVVEQAGSGKFNRAMLMNVGALEALKQYRFSCFIFHDVDLLPEDDRNLYTCPEQPRHMSIAIDVMKYKLPYNDIFGGVSAMTVDQFRAVNGFSNKFWGWGGEDDDMSNRIKFHGFFISRYPANIGRYTMLSHKKDEPNPRRYQFLHDGKKRFKSDGLVSVKYRVLDIQLRRLYTWVYVDLQPS